MRIRPLFDAKSSTWTYLLTDERSKEAVLIDPVWEQYARDAALIRELGVSLRFTLETHVHADHVTAAWLFRERLGSRIVLSAASGAQGADRLLAEGDEVAFGSESLRVLATPGHTDGCVTYVSADRSVAFTGDALLVRAAGRTDFQQGSAGTLYRSVHDKLFSLPDDCVIYPAHDYQGRLFSTVAEERRWNPRLGGQRSAEDFEGYMANLGLPHPKQMDVAVPANLRCGRPDPGNAMPRPDAEPEWGPAVLTYAGVREIAPEWVQEHLGEVEVLDVREPSEFEGELGHIQGARLLPLGQLRAKLSEIPKDRPVITVCRSGGRSAQAALVLEKEGFRSANLAGGMLAWCALASRK